jgi:hypothetical protein
MAYQILWQHHGVIKRHFGDVSGQDIVGAILDVESSPNFDTLRWVINDFLDCTSLTLNDSAFETIVAQDIGAHFVNPNIRIAIVATKPEVITLSQRYTDETADGYVTRIFSGMAEARAWLGLPVERTSQPSCGA